MSLAGVTVKVTKAFDGEGIEALRSRIKACGGVSVRVGLPSGKTTTDGSPLTTLGFTHEFGAPQKNIPERPFMRPTVQNNGKKYSDMMGAGLGDIARDKTNAEKVLGTLGAVATSDVQKQIRDGKFEPNSEKTIKRKGSSKPLIDTGNMRQSITWELAHD